MLNINRILHVLYHVLILQKIKILYLYVKIEFGKKEIKITQFYVL